MLNGPGFQATVTFFSRTWSGGPLLKDGGSAPSTPRFLDQAAGRRIDDGGNASGLRIERVPGRHRLLQRLEDACGDAIDTADTGHFPDLRRARVASG